MVLEKYPGGEVTSEMFPAILSKVIMVCRGPMVSKASKTIVFGIAMNLAMSMREHSNSLSVFGLSGKKIDMALVHRHAIVVYGWVLHLLVVLCYRLLRALRLLRGALHASGTQLRNRSVSMHQRPRQFHQAAHKPFRLSQGQTEHRSKRQGGFNREV